MKIFLGAKFTGANNRKKLEEIRKILIDLKQEVFIGPIDLDKGGEKKMPPEVFMPAVLKKIKESDLIIFEHEKVSTGMGIEAGYAMANKKEIIVLYEPNAEKSNSLEGIAKSIIEYKNMDDLKIKLGKVLK